MKKFLLVLGLFFSWQPYAQNDTFRNFLILGVERAEQLIGAYVNPMSDGLMYGLTAGWYNSAVVDNKWSVDISLITNGSFIPSEKLTTTVDISAIENLRVAGGGSIVEFPTILGGTDTSVTLIATLNGQDYEFEAPTGIGLADVSLLPAIFLQSSVGLPFHTEAVVRFIPKIDVDDVAAGIFGLGLKNEVSQWWNKGKPSKIAVSALVAFNTLDVDYKLKEGQIVTGTDHRIQANLDTWLFEAIASTNNPIYNGYIGLGYITGNATYDMRGTYNIENSVQSVSFTDPFNVQNNIDGMRLSLGGKVRMGWFSINADYTFQGYNNLSLGLNFDLFNKERLPAKPKEQPSNSQ